MARELAVYDLGSVEYEDGLALQRAFSLARRAGLVKDSLLLVEHPQVLTIGRSGSLDHLRIPQEELERRGVELFHTDRGGDITWHGPGQVVGYPIIDLAPERRDVRRYVGDLEESMISCARDYGVEAGRIAGWTGVWLGQKGIDARKLGAIGVRISQWITSHGFAFNVAPPLQSFEMIVPCGIGEAGVTSLERELGAAPLLSEVRAKLADKLAERLGARRLAMSCDQRNVAVVVLRRTRCGLDHEVLLLKRHPHRGGFWQPVTGTIERHETPQQCAERELTEETGSLAKVAPLNYSHSFAFGPSRTDRAPRIFTETSFYALIDGGEPPKLDPSEHSEYCWLPPKEAAAQVRFAGLRRAIKLAAEAVAKRR